MSSLVWPRRFCSVCMQERREEGVFGGFDFDGFLRDLGRLHVGTFVGDATDEHVGDFVLIGREGHVGVYVDVGFVEGVIDSSAVGGLVGGSDGASVLILSVGDALGAGNSLQCCFRVTPFEKVR